MITVKDTEKPNQISDHPYQEIYEDEKEKHWYTLNTREKNWHSKLRIQFIRKVYGIVTTQLLITLLFCFFATSLDGYLVFQQNAATHAKRRRHLRHTFKI